MATGSKQTSISTKLMGDPATGIVQNQLPWQREITFLNPLGHWGHKNEAVNEIANIISAVPDEHPKKLNVEDIEEWLEQDSELKGVEDLTDDQIIESVMNPEKENDEEEEDDLEEEE